MADRLTRLRDLLQATAPMTAALSRRMHGIPALRDPAQQANSDYGDDYAGGQIGKSMQAVLN